MPDFQSRFPEVFRSLETRKDGSFPRICSPGSSEFASPYTDMLRASDVFRHGNPDAKIKEVKSWLNSKGVKDFEPVPLSADQLKKVRYCVLHSIST